MKDKLLSILKDSRFYLILGAVILLVSVFGVSFTFNSKIKSLTVRDHYDYCIASPMWANRINDGLGNQTVWGFDDMNRYCINQAANLHPDELSHWNEYYKMYGNIFVTTATLGALMFIYGLAMQGHRAIERRRSEP